MCVIFTKIASVNKKNNVHKKHGFINIFVFILQVLYTGCFFFFFGKYVYHKQERDLDLHCKINFFLKITYVKKS